MSLSYTGLRGIPNDVTHSNHVTNYQTSNRRGPKVIQSGVTQSYTPPYGEVKARKHTADGEGYPGGADVVNMQIRDGEPVFTSVRAGRGQKNTALSSLNGISFQGVASIEQLELGLSFAGQSQNDYDVINQKGDSLTNQNGFAVLFYGSTTLKMQWLYDIYPGDKLVWRLMSEKEAKSMMAVQSDPGVPAGKLMAIIGPLDWAALQYQLKTVIHFMTNPVSIYKMSEKPVYAFKRSTGQENSFVRAAQSLKTCMITTSVRAAEQMALRGIIDINSPKEMVKKNAKETFLKHVLDLVEVLQAGGIAPIVTSLDQVVNSRGNTLEYLTYLKEQYLSDLGQAPSSAPDERLTQSHAYFDNGVHWETKDDMNGGELNALYGSLSTETEYMRARQIERLEKTMWLAKAYGVIEERQYTIGGQQNYNPAPVEDILGSLFFLYAEPGRRRPFITGNALKDGNFLDPSLKRDLKSYYLASKNHVHHMNQSMATMRSNLERKEVGTAMTYVEGGSSLVSNLDVLIRGK